MKNYYQILGVAQDSDQKAIRKAWLKKAKLHHPDHNPDDPTAEELFKDAQEAYRILSDPFLRNRYDLGGFASLVSDPASHKEISNYFYAHTFLTSIKQYEELAVIFTYTGQGRVFKKPTFDNFFITGSPYVSHRMVYHDNHMLKETTFTYLVCPLKLGVFEISKGSIRINAHKFTSEPILITVTSNVCHFTSHEGSDGKPLKLTLHLTFQKETEPQQFSEHKKNHVVLIPRSRSAFIFHSIGMTMKIVFMIWGGIMLSYYLQIPFLLGCVSGGLLGGLNCMIMYRLAGVRSKYFHARKYGTVQSYLDKGYRLGESSGVPMVDGNFFYNLNKLIF